MGDDSTPPAIITPDAAIGGAEKGVEEYGLLRRPDWARLLTPFLSPRVGPIAPLLVRRLSAPDPEWAYYYLVPFGATAETIGAVARVHAVSGVYQEATAIPRSEKQPWGRRPAEWEAEARKTHARTVDVGRALVWKPCVESASSFYPFRVVTIDGRLRYERIDGQMFDALTDLPPYPGDDRESGPTEH